MKEDSTPLNRFLTNLTLIFITLKLIGEIEWSWVWVLSLIWVPFILGGLAEGLAKTLEGEKDGR